MNNHSNQTFIFDGKTKLFTIALMVIGAVCLALSYFTDADHLHIRFWTNFLQNSVFFVGIAFTAVLFLATHTMAWGGWFAIFKRVPEAMMTFLYPGIIIFAIFGVFIMTGAEGTELLYLWNDKAYLTPDGAHFDKLAFHKSAFVNPINYLLTALVIAVWSVFAFMIRKLSIKQDSVPFTVTASNTLPDITKKIRLYSAVFLPIAGFSSAYAIWQWIMSVDTHWYSTLFAWYVTVSMFVSMCCLMFLIILFLKTKGLMQGFTKEHMHDIGKYIFGFSIFWTYLWFSQFLLIWYANNGEETQYFFIRFEQFKVVFFANLLINFITPFFVLMMNTTKRTLGTLGFMAGLLFLGHWLDFYQMVRPGVWYNYEHKAHLGILHNGDNHGHDTHGENTYKFNEGKAVLTQHSEGQHSHDNAAHSSEGHSHKDGEHKAHTAEEHSHDTHASGDHGHDAHAGGDHAHGHEKQFLVGVHIPGVLDLGSMLGFLGLFLFVTFTSLSKASLYPKNDPYLAESEHHHS
jgi:hypothetical protein